MLAGAEVGTDGQPHTIKWTADGSAHSVVLAEASIGQCQAWWKCHKGDGLPKKRTPQTWRAHIKTAVLADVRQSLLALRPAAGMITILGRPWFLLRKL